MFTIFFIFYNIFERYKKEWLNLSEGEGLTTGLIYLVLDFFVFVLFSFIYSYFNN